MLRRWITLLMALALLAAACSSSDDGGGSTAGDSVTTETGGDTEETSPGTEAMEPGSQVGITDTELNLAVIYGDLAPFVEAGLVPALPAWEDVLDFFVTQANEEGVFGERTASVEYSSFAAGATAGDQLPACISATEDRENFIVFMPGGMAEETVLCVTEQHETLALMIADAQTGSLYERSNGRLFNNAMGTRRLMEVAIAAYAEQGFLDGKVIGIIRPDNAADAEVAATITEQLEANGYEVAHEISLTCANNTCQGFDGAVERFKTEGVDAIFSLLGVLAYPEFVAIAGAADYVPQYFSSDYANQVFQTTARFMQNSAEWYDGAIGASSSLLQQEPDEIRSECNDDYTAGTGDEWEPLTDGWLLVGNICEMFARTARVIAAIEADGLEVGQDTFIKYMEAETVLNGDRQGDFGPGKHDAYDRYVLLRYDQNCMPDAEDGITGCWKEIEGTRGEDVD